MVLSENRQVTTVPRSTLAPTEISWLATMALEDMYRLEPPTYRADS